MKAKPPSAIVEFLGRQIPCQPGEILRRVLLRAQVSPHNGAARQVNCRGLGTCGTCAVRISGPISPPNPRGRERWRLGFPPHRPDAGLRLACQVRVQGNLKVEKYTGFWGERVQERPRGANASQLQD